MVLGQNDTILKQVFPCLILHIGKDRNGTRNTPFMLFRLFYFGSKSDT